ncbi:hypothetical protein SNEBB_003499 [Seison nebaliae]|nr:hypothetical protein SNEBB_003499 [Seison nebaliae]
MSVEIFKHPTNVKYRSSVFSVAFWFTVLIFLLCIYVPYWLLIVLGGPWIYDDFVEERPYMKFSYDSIIQLDSNAFFSTINELNVINAEKLRAPLIYVYEHDSNDNGIPDYFDMTINMLLRNDDKLATIKIILLFDTYLSRDKKKITLPVVIDIDGITRAPNVNIDISGTFFLTQTKSLNPKDEIDYSDRCSADMISVLNTNQFLDKKRNGLLTIKFIPTHKKIDTKSGSFRELNIQLHIDYNKVQYRVKASLLTVFKWFVLEYLLLFFIIWFLLYHLRWFIFENKLIPTCTVHMYRDKFGCQHYYPNDPHYSHITRAL